jgi:hypothetical protein
VGEFTTARSAAGFKWKPMKELLVSGNVVAKFHLNGLYHTAFP